MKSFGDACTFIEENIRMVDLSKLRGENLSIELTLTGEGGGVLSGRIDDGKATTARHPDPAADCGFALSAADFWLMCEGGLNPGLAFMTGRIKARGSLSKIAKLRKLI